jgi:hypothetical protein
MDTMKANGTSQGASAGKEIAPNDAPEQLLDVFKAAALSVTKLYKQSAAAETRARRDGYQDCLDDLLAFLDKENIGLDDGEGWRIRRWATERLDGQQASVESDEEVDKAERTSSPEVTRTNEEPQRTGSAPPTAVSVNEEPERFRLPVQENFTFSSSHPYPNIATLDLSDSLSHDNPSLSSPRTGRSRKAGSRTSSTLGRGAGSKRKMDFNEFFGGCLGGTDPFGQGGKRSRHT